MNTPTISEQIDAATAALREFDDASPNVMDDQEVQIINLLVALRFLCDRADIDFELLNRTARQTFEQETK